MISCDSVMVSHGQWLWSAINWPHHDNVQSMVIMNVKWHHSHFIVNRCQRQWWPHMINHDWGNCLWWPSKTTSFSTERVVAILPTFMMDNGMISKLKFKHCQSCPFPWKSHAANLLSIMRWQWCHLTFTIITLSIFSAVPTIGTLPDRGQSFRGCGAI